MSSVTGVYWKVLLVLLVLSAFALAGSLLGERTWFIVVLPLACGTVGWLGQTIGVRKGWLIRSERYPNMYRPKSMLVTVIASVAGLSCGLFAIGLLFYMLWVGSR